MLRVCQQTECQNTVFAKQLCSPHYYRLNAATKKQKALAYLGGKCVGCGTTEHLQFDHIKRANKEFMITQRLLHRWEKLVKELKRCQLLCQKCHSKKTIKDLNQTPATHGTTCMYNNYACRCYKCKAANTRHQYLIRHPLSTKSTSFQRR